MSRNAVSRRGFFNQVAGAVAAPIAAVTPATTTTKVWVIVGLNWEYNDEWTYQEGESPLPQVYFDEDVANAECQRMCDEFFASQSPHDFEVDWNGLELDEDDDEQNTWGAVCDAGFPNPYYVMECKAHEQPADPR